MDVSVPVLDAATQAIFEYIEIFYNRQPLHRTLAEYRTPAAVETGRVA